MKPQEASELFLELDPSASDDFRWPYFGSICVQGLGLAARQEVAQATWAKAREMIINLQEARKEAVRALAAIESNVRANLSDDDPVLKAKKTKDEREAYRVAVVEGTAEWQEVAADMATIEKEIALLEADSEAQEKTWLRMDRILRFFERVLGCLSTFAPESEASKATLAGRLPVRPEAGATGLATGQETGQETGQGSEPPTIPDGQPYFEQPPEGWIENGPPAGLEEYPW